MPMKPALRVLGGALLSLCLPASLPAFAHAPGAQSYAEHPEARAFIERMVAEGFERDTLETLLKDTRRQESILEAIARPAEKRLNWGEYREIFLGRSRIEQGVEFWEAHQATLARASDIYGVAPEIIVAIIGVETRYGRHAGGYRVMDALATLAFDYPPRSPFFSGELRELLYLLEEESLDPASLKGSYAGAMGYGQFIPSSYRHYAVDFDRDGTRDLLNNPVDAIGSVANYFHRHGWKPGAPVTVPARLEGEVDEALFNAKLKPERSLAQWAELGVLPETPLAETEQPATALKLEFDDQEPSYWLGLHNFYVITRYNRSHLYAMAVHQLSQAILEARRGRAG